ncbi:hypothetical protein ACPA0F_20330 [Solibacillus silvestris]
MLKAKIVNVEEIYFGDEAFENGEEVQITASVDNGEGGYVELFSKKLNRPYRVYSGEYDAFEVIKG